MKLHLISAAKAKRIHRFLNSLKLTLLCGFLTLLVLRGTLGAGKFGTPGKDFEEIKLQFERVHLNRKQLNFASRVLNEVKIEKKPTIDLVQNGAETAQNDAIADRNEGNPVPNDEKRPQNDVRFPQFDVKIAQERMVGKPYSLGPKISDWDSKRMVESELSRQDKPQIMLITGSQPSPCENPAGDNFLLKSMKNKQDYGRLHGIEIFYNMANLDDDDQMSGFWAKLPLLRKMMLTHPNVDWFWWMDSDALFTDMAFEVPMGRYENYNLVLHGWGDMVYKDKNWVGLNTGSFLLRNCQWSLDLLDAWATLGPEGETRETGGKMLSETLSGRPDNFEADDQSALVSLLVTHRETWGEKVFLENSYYLHGYWPTLVHRYEDLMKTSHNGFGDDRWPFVTHFVGCKPCKNTVADSQTVCFEQMQRAFNFADNQVLELYGFRHQSLSTDKVQHIDDGLIASSDI